MVRESRIAEGSAPTHCRADRTCVRDLSPLGTPWVTNSARTARLCPTRRWWQLGRLSGGWDPAGFTLAPGPQSGYQVGPVSPGPSLSVRCPPQSTWPFLSPLAPSVHVTHSLSVHRPLPSAQPAGIQESSPSSLPLVEAARLLTPRLGSLPLHSVGQSRPSLQAEGRSTPAFNRSSSEVTLPSSVCPGRGGNDGAFREHVPRELTGK